MLRTRVLSAIVLIPLVAGATYAGGWVLAGLLFIVAILATFEFFRLMQSEGYRPSLAATAVLIAARPFSPRASAVGSALAVGMFLTTLSFLITTPGVWEPSAGGFPALSGKPGQFLIKDLALLGISLWSLGEAWQTSERATA